LKILLVMIVHITFWTSDPQLSALPRVSRTAGFCKKYSLLIYICTLCILEGSFSILPPTLLMFLRGKCW